jgi:hypothetical protein
MALPMLNGRPLGYTPNPPDYRDFGLGRTPRMLTADQPAMNNGEFMGDVLDQGQQGSCTAHTGAEDREYLHWKQLATLGHTVAPPPGGLFSPAFLYQKERELDGTLDQGDCGSTGRSSCLALRKFGCALRADMPYSDADYSTVPTNEQLASALKWPTGQFHFLHTVQDAKDCIASGYNFRIGFAVDEGFGGIGADGIWYLAGNIRGWHETLGYGYDDGVNGGSFLIRNSWGRSFGKNGDFYMPYQVAADPKYVIDKCIQHLGVW